MSATTVLPPVAIGAEFESTAGNRWRVVALDGDLVTVEHAARRRTEEDGWEAANRERFTWNTESLFGPDMKRVA